MKAVAAALVLIAGAAVVLWYGNTLNSWVLGGLIGGLAALLLSIPISLTVFSYLSKRHDERTRIEEPQEQYLQEEEYPRPSARIARRPREVEGYVVAEEVYDDEWQEEVYAPRVPRALPAPRRQGPRNSEKLSPPQQGQPVPGQRTQQARSKETVVLQSATKKINPPPGYMQTSSLSQHRADALRTARLEAVQSQQEQDDGATLPTATPKRGSTVRNSQLLAKQNEQNNALDPQRPPRPSRQLPPQPNQPRQRRNVEPLPPQQGSHRVPPDEGEDVARKPDPRTDYIVNAYPETGPLRRSVQSNHAAQPNEQRSDENSTTGNVNRPLIRRAPYMYDDDPLRQKLAEQLDTPAVRRSSRFDEDEYDE